MERCSLTLGRGGPIGSSVIGQHEDHQGPYTSDALCTSIYTKKKIYLIFNFRVL